MLLLLMMMIKLTERLLLLPPPLRLMLRLRTNVRRHTKMEADADAWI